MTSPFHYSHPGEGDLQHWRDSRADAKAAANRKHATMLRLQIYRAAHKSRQEAIAAGAPRYIGQPCRYGHGNLRYVGDGNCVECGRLRRAARRRQAGMQAHPERPGARHPLRSAKKAAARYARATRLARKRSDLLA